MGLGNGSELDGMIRIFRGDILIGVGMGRSWIDLDYLYEYI